MVTFQCVNLENLIANHFYGSYFKLHFERKKKLNEIVLCKGHSFSRLYVVLCPGQESESHVVHHTLD